MLMKADTNIVFDDDIVLYDGREASVIAGDSTLSALALSGGALVPAFSAATKNYTIAVANAVETTTVTATGSQTGQVIKLGSTTLTSGTASAAKNLAVGENIIAVTVTSPDGNSTATYQVLVTRELPPNQLVYQVYKSVCCDLNPAPFPQGGERVRFNKQIS